LSSVAEHSLWQSFATLRPLPGKLRQQSQGLWLHLRPAPALGRRSLPWVAPLQPPVVRPSPWILYVVAGPRTHTSAHHHPVSPLCVLWLTAPPPLPPYPSSMHGSRWSTVCLLTSLEPGPALTTTRWVRVPPAPATVLHSLCLCALSQQPGLECVNRNLSCPYGR
jgi:hypothetical protein